MNPTSNKPLICGVLTTGPHSSLNAVTPHPPVTLQLSPPAFTFATSNKILWEIYRI